MNTTTRTLATIGTAGLLALSASPAQAQPSWESGEVSCDYTYHLSTNGDTLPVIDQCVMTLSIPGVYVKINDNAVTEIVTAG